MSSKSEEKFETGLEKKKPIPTREELEKAQSELRGETGNAFLNYERLLAFEEGGKGKYAELIGAALMLASLFFGKEKKEKKEKDKKKSTDKDSDSVGMIGAGKIEKKEDEEDKKAEIDEKLQQKKESLGKPKEVASSEAEKLQKFESKNIFYVGDSYMAGITHGRVENNKYAASGRPFVSTGKVWEGKDVQTYALRALNNPNCKLLVLNGGLNDFYSSGNPKKTYERVRGAYQRIFDFAKEKSVRVIVYNIPKIPKKHKQKEQVDHYTDELNKYLEQEWLTSGYSGPGFGFVETNDVVGNNWGDKIHPNQKAYKELFEQIQGHIA